MYAYEVVYFSLGMTELEIGEPTFTHHSRSTWKTSHSEPFPIAHGLDFY